MQIAERIVRGMQLFGAYRNEEAKEYVGELGWKVVQNNGGWQEMRYNTNIKYLSLVRKDLQNQVKIIKKEEKNLKLIA